MRTRTAAATLAGVLMLLSVPITVEGQQQPPSNTQPSGLPHPATLDDQIEAGDDEVAVPARKLIDFNEYDGNLFSLRIGGGFLFEYAGFAQNEESKEQIALNPQPKTRDLRILLRGRLKFERPTTWSAGIMRDFVTNDWTFRQTGVMVDVPEIWGQIFIGRTKEGFSLNKVMVGYAGWTMERTPMSDASIPILADGVKWLGYLPSKHLIWNAGFYGDILSKGESFSTYAHQAVGRLAWVPLMSEETERVLHLGVNFRDGKPADGMLQLRSRPEAWPAPFFVDTGRFPAKNTKTTALEAYYRPANLLVGTEYLVQFVDSAETGDPVFHGGTAFMSWVVTGETRAYNTRGGYFDQISPARPVFQGGHGAWEVVTEFSYIDLDSRFVRGGRFWRFTPMANWHLSDNVRLELAYGYSSLGRFGLTGATQFFQSRLQLQL